ncbi:unnamed protein product [Phytomonas sp. EM1]|nr:unnamed protein product [Phytomonas sp. EM1]|eukprot:CCW60675.1 unnamed protein product [Phytomonas sp. isolate EM1]
MSRMITNCSLSDCTTAVDNAANILNGNSLHITSKNQVRSRTTNPAAIPEAGFQPSQRPVMGAAAPLSGPKPHQRTPVLPKKLELKSVMVSRHDPYSLSLLHSPCTPMDGFLASYSDADPSGTVDSSASSRVGGFKKTLTPLSDLHNTSLHLLPTLYDTSPLDEPSSCCDVWRPMPISSTRTATDIIPGDLRKATSPLNVPSHASWMSISIASNALNELQWNSKIQELGSRSTSTIVGYTVDRSKGRPIPVRKVA